MTPSPFLGSMCKIEVKERKLPVKFRWPSLPPPIPSLRIKRFMILKRCLVFNLIVKIVLMSLAPTFKNVDTCLFLRFSKQISISFKNKLFKKEFKLYLLYLLSIPHYSLSTILQYIPKKHCALGNETGMISSKFFINITLVRIWWKLV